MTQFRKISFIPLLFLLMIITGLVSLTKLVQKPQDIRQKAAENPRTDIDYPITKKVLVLEFDPIIESQNNQRLHQVMGWNNPDELMNLFIQDIRIASEGTVNYEILSKQVVDDFPILLDGFDYTDETWMECWNNRSLCHKPYTVDYEDIFRKYNICSMNLSEIWIFGAPYMGTDEYAMKIPGDTPYNNQICRNYVFYRPYNIPDCGHSVFVMGWNYERGMAELLHSFGHRVEGTLAITIANCQWDWNKYENYEIDFWNKYIFNQEAVNLFGKHISNCGTVHSPPNGRYGYDYLNSEQVNSLCEDWLNFPIISENNTILINCSRWDCTQLGFMKWWLYHLPKYAGLTNGKWNNWWKYIADYDCAVNGICEASPTPTSSPNFTLEDLRILVENYLGINDSDYYPHENKINILDAGWVIRWIE